MKYNKLFLGLGIVALACTTSCKDNENEFTPADPVAVPPVYFSMDEPTVYDLGEDDTEITVTFYRAEAGEEKTYDVTATMTDANGSTSSASLFGLPQTVTFAKGETTAPYKVTFSIPELEPTLDYYLTLKVAGEGSPYLTTDITITLCYVPWETLEDCTLHDDAVFAAFGGEYGEWTVTVQEHPIKKGFFRVYQPYATGPFDYMYNWDEFPATDPHYLYINAMKADEVFFADAKGDPQVFYNTGLYCAPATNFVEEYGYIRLVCGYSCVLLDQPLEWNNGKAYLASNFTEDAGVMTSKENNGKVQRKIKFEDKLYTQLTLYPSNGPLSTNGWALYLDGADDSDEWTDLGEGEYTDGILSQLFFEADVPTYPVRVLQSNEDENLYRMINPYGEGVFPYGTPWNETYNIDFSVEDPEFVVVGMQTAYADSDGTLDVLNAAYMYTSGIIQTQMTKEEVIANGFNDTFVDGVVNFAHPCVVVGNSIYSVWKQENYVPGKLVMPTGTAETPANIVKKQNNVKSRSNIKVDDNAIARSQYRFVKLNLKDTYNGRRK